MFSFTFSLSQFKETQKTFGPGKTRLLYDEFKKHTEAALKQASQSKDKEEQRLVFHNLRSAALVFGLNKLSGFSAKMERRILANQEVLAKDFAECMMIYNKSVAKVEVYLKGLK